MYCYNIKKFSALILPIFWIMHCMVFYFRLKEISVKLTDNVLAENFQYLLFSKDFFFLQGCKSTSCFSVYLFFNLRDKRARWPGQSHGLLNDWYTHMLATSVCVCVLHKFKRSLSPSPTHLLSNLLCKIEMWAEVHTHAHKRSHTHKRHRINRPSRCF